MAFNELLFYNKVPKSIINRTKKYMDVYNLGLCDAFEEAVKELAKPGTELYKAWYYNDYRRFIPCAYTHESLDFSKYPLKYEL